MISSAYYSYFPVFRSNDFIQGVVLEKSTAGRQRASFPSSEKMGGTKFMPKPMRMAQMSLMAQAPLPKGTIMHVQAPHTDKAQPLVIVLGYKARPVLEGRRYSREEAEAPPPPPPPPPGVKGGIVHRKVFGASATGKGDLLGAICSGTALKKVEKKVVAKEMDIAGAMASSLSKVTHS